MATITEVTAGSIDLEQYIKPVDTLRNLGVNRVFAKRHVKNKKGENIIELHLMADSGVTFLINAKENDNFYSFNYSLDAPTHETAETF